MGSKLFDLTGLNAVVTGGGRGLGRAIAMGLAEHGARVAVCGRNMANLEETAAALGDGAFALAMDVTSDADVERGRDALIERFRHIDILVNNAGIDPHYASMEKTTQEQWDQILAVNLTGVFRTARVIGSTMLKWKRGSIINLGSIAGRVALKRQVPYCATKGGVEQLTKALAYDWAEYNVRVNCLAYGFIDTDLTMAVLQHPHIGPRLLSRVPMGRFGRIEDVAAAAVFLASPGASYVTGSTVVVDGGWTAT